MVESIFASRSFPLPTRLICHAQPLPGLTVRLHPVKPADDAHVSAADRRLLRGRQTVVQLQHA